MVFDTSFHYGIADAVGMANDKPMPPALRK